MGQGEGHFGFEGAFDVQVEFGFGDGHGGLSGVVGVWPLWLMWGLWVVVGPVVVGVRPGFLVCEGSWAGRWWGLTVPLGQGTHSGA